MTTRPKKWLEQVQDAIRLKHYSYRIEQSYVAWIRRFILFDHKRHPKAMVMAEIEAVNTCPEYACVWLTFVLFFPILVFLGPGRRLVFRLRRTGALIQKCGQHSRTS
jgi:hypothetical protein